MKRKKPTLASPIASEDLERGLYVVVLNEISQWPACLFGRYDGTGFLNVRTLPCDEPQPLKVVAVCLPFVTTVRHDGRPVTLDVRQCELARLDDEYARHVVKLLRGPTRQGNLTRRKR